MPLRMPDEKARGDQPDDLGDQENRMVKRNLAAAEERDAEHGGEDEHAEHADSPHIDPAGCPGRAGRDETCGQRDQDDPDRYVDQEDSTPGPDRDEHTPDDRPDDPPDGQDAGEHAESAVAIRSEMIGHNAGGD